MPANVSAVFAADFEQFKTGSAQAVAELQKLEGEAAKAGTSLTTVGESAGDMGTQLSDAAVRTQELVVAEEALATATTEAAVASMTMREGLNATAAAAGLTFASMGVLGVAAAAYATLMATYNFTRWIVGFTELDDAIAKTNSSLLGLGGVAAETAAAKLDVITRAIHNGADASISYTDAIAFNVKAFDDLQAAAARAKAPQEFAEQMAKWHAEIDAIEKSGALPALTDGINSHLISVKELSDSYHVSQGAINLFKRELTEEAAVAKKELAEEAAAFRANAAAKAQAVREADATILQTWRDEAKAAKELDDVETKLQEFQDRRFKAEVTARQKQMADINATVVAGALAIRQVEEQQADATSKQWLSTTDYQIQQIWRVVTEQERAFKGSLEQREAYSALVESAAQKEADALIAIANTVVVGTGPTAPNAGAGRTSGGVAGMVLPSDILSSVAGMDSLSAGIEASRQVNFASPTVPGVGGASVVNHIYVNGTAADVARQVADEILRTLKQGRQLPAS